MSSSCSTCCPRTAFYMDTRIRACYPKLPPMVGYAATATFRSAFAPTSGNVYSGLDQQVAAFAELPGPPIVVFQDLDSTGDVGDVRRGDVHDLQGVRRRRPDHQRGGPRSRSGRGDELPLLRRRRHLRPRLLPYFAAHVPVHVGGVQVNPGDLLHGDRNGVTTIPNEIASEVAHACAELVAAEQIVLDYLKRAGHQSEGLRGSTEGVQGADRRAGETPQSLKRKRRLARGRVRQA